MNLIFIVCLPLPLPSPRPLSMCIDFQRLPLGCLKYFLSALLSFFYSLSLLLSLSLSLCFFLFRCSSSDFLSRRYIVFMPRFLVRLPALMKKFKSQCFLTFHWDFPPFSFAFSAFLQVFPSAFFIAFSVTGRVKRFPVIDDFATRLANIFEVG